MPEKRKDSKGRVLKTGESERKDGIYQYRYIDGVGKRQTIYASSLAELRKQEDDIQKAIYNGVDYARGEIAVSTLVDKYLETLKHGNPRTLSTYTSSAGKVKAHEIGRMMVRDVKTSDAKLFINSLSESGLMFDTVSLVKAVMSSAFQMACEEDIIVRNPFGFKMNFIEQDATPKQALTELQQERLLSFLKTHNVYSRYYDRVVILLNTGLRVSEFVGLQLDDIDFGQRLIRVDHQYYSIKGGRRLGRPKSESGARFVPMNDAAEISIRNMVRERMKRAITGNTGDTVNYLYLNSRGVPDISRTVQSYFQRILKAYNQANDEKIDELTPHVLRHTFCSNMARSGMNVSVLKYIMGHASANVTLETYTHTDKATVMQEYNRIFSCS